MEKLVCQDGEMRSASRRMGAVHVLWMRAADHLRRHGPISLARRSARFLERRAHRALRTDPVAQPRHATAVGLLGLEPGEWVIVKSEHEIRETLDATGRSAGLGFMPGMYRYCGQRLRVFKRVQNIVLEGTGETRKLKDTVVLDGVLCDGEGFACDRSCFYFWKEAWLSRSPTEAADPRPPDGPNPASPVL